MDSNCRKLGETPYRECRKQAAIYNDALGSMERAAEMLGVSVNTLSNYELGVTVPPVNIIIVMADLYRAPQLKTMYCKNECLIGRCILECCYPMYVGGKSFRMNRAAQRFDEMKKFMEE